MGSILRTSSASLVLCLAAFDAAAQGQPDMTAMSLQDLLGVEVVSSASKFPQQVREAPASITIVTAEDIRRYGHRTLADVLRGVRGVYSTYDRHYEYAGIRGFSRPGDNKRVLLLVDGHRLNDGVYEMAPIGTEFPIDVSLIDRVEIIRGPGSSLYGTSAFFGVINVVTRTGGERPGAEGEAHAGSQSTGGGGLSFGHLFGDNEELLVAGSTYRSAGAGRLFFPEFVDSPTSGVASDMDGDRSSKVYASYARKHLSFHAGFADRHKNVPTASFGTVFADGREATTDRRGFANVVFDGPLGRGWSSTARLAYDFFSYAGTYPFDYGELGTVLSEDATDSHGASGELTARRRIGRSHLFTLGTEVRQQFHAHQRAFDEFESFLDVNNPGTIAGVYAQDEMRVTKWLLVNAGVRLDRYPSFGMHTAPRVGVVLLPRAATAIKVLHGQAFRAPNVFELYYTPMPPGFELEPENIRSTEVVWEENVSKHVRTTVAVFDYGAKRLIVPGSAVSADDDNYNDPAFVNAGAVHTRGVEAEVEARLPIGVVIRASHTSAWAQNDDLGTAMSNSPRNLSTVGAQIPLWRFYLATEGRLVGRRQTLTGDTIDAFFVPNVTLTSPPERRLQLTVSVYNAFDRVYADPGAEEHTQQSIPQDGRTAMARLRVRF